MLIKQGQMNKMFRYFQGTSFNILLKIKGGFKCSTLLNMYYLCSAHTQLPLKFLVSICAWRLLSKVFFFHQIDYNESFLGATL